MASLYYAFAVDVISDFMSKCNAYSLVHFDSPDDHAVLFMPMKLTWNLNMPQTQKIGVRILFGTGLICILFATIRVVQIGS